MKENLLILFCFIAGIGLGLSQQAPEWLHGHDLPMIILSLLILQVGISLGAGTDLRQIARSLNPLIYDRIKQIREHHLTRAKAYRVDG